MAKPSFFTWSDYRSALDRLKTLPQEVPVAVIAGLGLTQTVVTFLNWSLVWLPVAPWSRDWWLAVAALVMPLALWLQMFSLLTIRRHWGDGLVADWSAMMRLLRLWAALTAVLVLQGIVFFAPTWLPR